jgi:hypothetical protein
MTRDSDSQKYFVMPNALSACYVARNCRVFTRLVLPELTSASRNIAPAINVELLSGPRSDPGMMILQAKSSTEDAAEIDYSVPVWATKGTQRFSADTTIESQAILPPASFGVLP